MGMVHGSLFLLSYNNPSSSIILPDTINSLALTSIEDYAFYKCPALGSIVLGSNIVSIGFSTFSNSSLGSIVISHSLTTVGSGAFRYCRDLTRVIMGCSVDTINSSAFSRCDSLNSIYFRGNAPALVEDYVFYGIYPTIYYIPATSGWESAFTGYITAEWPLSPADTNFDYEINIFDFAVLTSKWSESGCSETNNWCEYADFNHDGIVYVEDLLLLSQDWLFP